MTRSPLLQGLLLALLFATSLQPAVARVYQWVDPQSGRTQLSGTPPAWYRSDRPGPRVFVIEDGRLIDDTAVAVTEERRRMLRRQAFAAARKQERQQSRSQELARLKAALQQRRIDLETAREELARLSGGQAPATPAAPAPEPAGGPPATAAEESSPAPPADEEQTIAQLKALIEAWDRQRTAQARSMLEAGEGGATTTPPVEPAAPPAEAPPPVAGDAGR